MLTKNEHVTITEKKNQKNMIYNILSFIVFTKYNDFLKYDDFFAKHFAF